MFYNNMFLKIVATIWLFFVVTCENDLRNNKEEHSLQIEFRRQMPGDAEKYLVLNKELQHVGLRSFQLNNEIPYEIANVRILSTIESAMDICHRYTCLKFRPKTPNDTDYMFIDGNSTDCVTTTAENVINIGLPDLCLIGVGTTLNLFMHALGFEHEHKRPDRDDYIIIHEENIIKGYESQFEKLSEYDTLGLPYDFDSVLHFSSVAFSTSDEPTIEPRDGYKQFDKRMGQRWGFSKGDITKINKKLSCPEKTQELNFTDTLYYAK